MQRQHVTLIVGEYRTTRVVEQIASLYSVVQQNPCNLTEIINARKRHIQSLRLEEPRDRWLWIFDARVFDPQDGEPWRKMMVDCAWLEIDLVFLDPFWTSSTFQNTRMSWIEQVLKFPAADGSPSKYPDRDPILGKPKGIVPFGSCVKISVHKHTVSTWSYGGSIWRPWQKPWTPEQHSLYPESVKQRVRFLLLAQLDYGSLLGRLDKACLLQILRCGAGLDSE